MGILWTLFHPVAGTAVARPEAFLPVLALAALWAMRGPNVFDWHARFETSPRLGWRAAFVFGACLVIIAGSRNSPFLYFQF